MKFISLVPEVTVDESALAGEFENSRKLSVAGFGEQHFFFKNRSKVYYIPYSEITRCFRRVQLIDTRMGCCMTGLDMENIVICGKDEHELAQIRLSNEREGIVILDLLREKCPQAQIGYVRPPEQTTCVRTEVRK